MHYLWSWQYIYSMIYGFLCMYMLNIYCFLMYVDLSKIITVANTVFSQLILWRGTVSSRIIICCTDDATTAWLSDRRQSTVMLQPTRWNYSRKWTTSSRLLEVPAKGFHVALLKSSSQSRWKVRKYTCSSIISQFHIRIGDLSITVIQNSLNNYSRVSSLDFMKPSSNDPRFDKRIVNTKSNHFRFICMLWFITV